MSRDVQKSRAFTLIELLVVIAIISLLASILLPSLDRARDLAKGIVCTSNLRSWGVSLAMYEQDNKGLLPRAYSSTGVGAWFNEPTIGPYVETSYVQNSWGHRILGGGLAVCPSHSEAQDKAQGRSYGFNFRIQYPQEFSPVPYWLVDWREDPNRNRRLVLSDGCNDSPAWAGIIPADSGTVHFYISNLYDCNYSRHGNADSSSRYSGKSNMLLGDWSVTSFAIDEIDPDENDDGSPVLVWSRGR